MKFENALNEKKKRSTPRVDTSRYKFLSGRHSNEKSSKGKESRRIARMQDGILKTHKRKKNKDPGFTDQGPTGLTASPERK